MDERDLVFLRLLESLAVLVVDMYDDFIRLREAALTGMEQPGTIKERYSVGFGEQRFLALQKKAHEVLALIRQTMKEVSPD
jgi:hypothetical protein